jgi:hypothetical protein
MNEQDQKTIIEREQLLHQQSVRKNVTEIKKYLHESFLEFGSSGKVFHFQDIITRLPVEDGQTSIEAQGFNLLFLASDCALLTYESKRLLPEGLTVRTLRSSVWKKFGNEWQMVFHQGTKKI